MCGVAGIVRFDGGAAHRVGDARRLRARLRHRGPDGEGEHVGPDAVLEHTRLAIVDPAGGAQPMTTPDGRFTLVFGGEVYDHLLLRRELAYPFRTRSDAETVLAAFAAWGEAAVPRLNGMFAFFVWDHELRRGFAARDRLGVKPFAYAWDGRELVFASEAQAIAHVWGDVRGGGRPRLHGPALLEYLVAPYFSGVEHPMFDGIEYLQPGHLLRVGPDGPRTERYYRFVVARDTADPQAVPERLRAALTAAVRRAGQADVPIGVYLSGGVDSTALAALARRTFAAPPPAYTVAFDGMDAFDYGASSIVVSNDRPFAELAARELGLELRAVAVPRAELPADLERIACGNDALPAWEQEIAQDRLARAVAAAPLKAVLVGDAADETHFGYHFLLDPAALASPRAIIERFGVVPIRREVEPDPVAAFTEKYARWTAGAASDGERAAATTTLIVERWLPRLLHNGDAHAMRASVEARVPFADVELLDVAASVGPALGLAGGVEKAALRAALGGIVPEAIRTRRKSALPKDQACGEIYRREAARLLAEPPAALADVVDLPRARALLAPARPPTEQERAILFRLIVACHFARHHGIA